MPLTGRWRVPEGPRLTGSAYSVYGSGACGASGSHFGAEGETLTIRHDSLTGSRSCPCAAVRAVAADLVSLLASSPSSASEMSSARRPPSAVRGLVVLVVFVLGLPGRRRALLRRPVRARSGRGPRRGSARAAAGNPRPATGGHRGGHRSSPRWPLVRSVRCMWSPTTWGRRPTSLAVQGPARRPDLDRRDHHRLVQDHDRRTRGGDRPAGLRETLRARRCATDLRQRGAGRAGGQDQCLRAGRWKP